LNILHVWLKNAYSRRCECVLGVKMLKTTQK